MWCNSGWYKCECCTSTKLFVLTLTCPVLCLLQGARPKDSPGGTGTVINVPGETKWPDRKGGRDFKCLVVLLFIVNVFYRFIGRGTSGTEEG